MTDGLPGVNEDDVAQLVRLMESFEKSPFDFLQLKVGDLEVSLGTGSPPAAAPAVTPAATPPPPPASATQPAAEAAPATAPATPDTPPAGSDPHAVPPEPAADVSSTHTEVVAPLMGIFYAQAEPGVPPFVTVGSEVNADTTVALIEVMKTFAPVSAGVAGTVAEVCAHDAELVEFGQTLFRIEPAQQEA